MTTTTTVSELNQAIDEIIMVKEDIQKVQNEIDAVEEKLQQDGDGVVLEKDDRNYYTEEKKYLRDKNGQLQTKEILLQHKMLQLIQDSPPGVLSSSKLTTFLRETRLDESMMDDILFAIQQSELAPAPPKVSPSELGKSEKHGVIQYRRFQVFGGKKDQPSILSDVQAKELASMRTDHQIVAYMMPHLQDVVSEGGQNYVVYNSEEYKWIQTRLARSEMYNEKPDLFISHPALVNKRVPFRHDDPELETMRQASPDQYQYGVLASWKLRSSLIMTCDATHCISDAAFGEIMNYGRHLCFGEDAPHRTSILLFDKRDFWIVEFVKGAVARVDCSSWTMGGSRAFLKEFLSEDSLVMVINEACERFQLSVTSDSFLGSGTFGYVFRAQYRSSGREVALKVTCEIWEGTNIPRLQMEYTRMQRAYRVCPGEVMGVEEDGFAVFERGAAMVLSEVGEHFSRLSPQSIMDSLKVLHQNRILHGDARLENVVWVRGMPRWIDFAEVYLEEFHKHQIVEREYLQECIRKRYGGYLAM
ncbi:protein kinase domain containing protein [Nitzschia inconspicua]|uniref:Protein kinase domain containing protein n=1 Tax=Nitzschia inconspicua TaxID=303405 RepID=A0A9K3PY60_9STRA|nr:protein kinase domain containing protein [Nitzschia inconspicua]